MLYTNFLNINQFVDIFLFLIQTYLFYIFLLTHSVHGGELQTLLDIEGCLTEEQTIVCLREILKALQYMHKLNIAHLDVKPQNILMNGEKVEGKTCKRWRIINS